MIPDQTLEALANGFGHLGSASATSKLPTQTSLVHRLIRKTTLSPVLH